MLGLTQLLKWTGVSQQACVQINTAATLTPWFNPRALVFQTASYKPGATTAVFAAYLTCSDSLCMQVSLLGCGVSTGWGAVDNTAKVSLS